MTRKTAKDAGTNRRIYAAQNEVQCVELFGVDAVHKEWKRLCKSKRVQAVVKASPHFLRNYMPAFEVVNGNGGGHYETYSRKVVIAMETRRDENNKPVKVMRDMVLVHELAHHISHTNEGHGPEFITNLLALYKAAYGTARAKELKERCAEYGCRHVNKAGKVVKIRGSKAKAA